MQYPQGMAQLKTKLSLRARICLAPPTSTSALISNYTNRSFELNVESAKTFAFLPLSQAPAFMLTIRKKLAEQQASKATGGSSGNGSSSGSGLKRKLSFRSQLLTAGMSVFSHKFNVVELMDWWSFSIHVTWCLYLQRLVNSVMWHQVSGDDSIN